VRASSRRRRRRAAAAAAAEEEEEEEEKRLRQGGPLFTAIIVSLHEVSHGREECTRDLWAQSGGTKLS